VKKQEQFFQDYQPSGQFVVCMTTMVEGETYSSQETGRTGDKATAEEAFSRTQKRQEVRRKVNGFTFGTTKNF